MLSIPDKEAILRCSKTSRWGRRYWCSCSGERLWPFNCNENERRCWGQVGRSLMKAELFLWCISVEMAKSVTMLDLYSCWHQWHMWLVHASWISIVYSTSRMASNTRGPWSEALELLFLRCSSEKESLTGWRHPNVFNNYNRTIISDVVTSRSARVCSLGAGSRARLNLSNKPLVVVPLKIGAVIWSFWR